MKSVMCTCRVTLVLSQLGRRELLCWPLELWPGEPGLFRVAWPVTELDRVVLSAMHDDAPVPYPIYVMVMTHHVLAFPHTCLW